jgi:hypothetical protein
MANLDGRARRASTGQIRLRKSPGRHRRSPPFAVPNTPANGSYQPSGLWGKSTSRAGTSARRPRDEQTASGRRTEIAGTRASFPYAFGVTSTGRYPYDVLASGWMSAGRPTSTDLMAEVGLVLEDATSGFCGAVLRWERGLVILEHRHGNMRTFALGAGFWYEGRPVVWAAIVQSPQAHGAMSSRKCRCPFRLAQGVRMALETHTPAMQLARRRSGTPATAWCGRSGSFALPLRMTLPVVRRSLGEWGMSIGGRRI